MSSRRMRPRRRKMASRPRHGERFFAVPVEEGRAHPSRPCSPHSGHETPPSINGSARRRQRPSLSLRRLEIHNAASATRATSKTISRIEAETRREARAPQSVLSACGWAESQIAIAAELAVTSVAAHSRIVTTIKAAMNDLDVGTCSFIVDPTYLERAAQPIMVHGVVPLRHSHGSIRVGFVPPHHPLAEAVTGQRAPTLARWGSAGLFCVS